MRVKAKGMGHYKNRIIERGQEFDVVTDEFSSTWMEKLPDSDHRLPEIGDDREYIDESKN